MSVQLGVSGARLAGLTAAIVVAGAVTGFALQRGNTVDLVADREVDATLDAVPYFDCPGGIALDDLHRGDRIYVTGRTGDGTWLELRAPFGTTSRVWVESHWVYPDGTVDSLPVTDCGERLLPAATGSVVTIPIEEPTTTSTSAATTTSTTSTSTTTSTTSTTSTTTTTTTLPADTDPPVIGALASDRADIWENLGYYGCPTQEHSATVSVMVADPSGVQSVALRIQVFDTPGIDTVVAMTFDSGSGLYSASVGPFGDGGLGPGPVTGDRPITLTVTATDDLDNAAQSPVDQGTIVLNDCANG